MDAEVNPWAFIRRGRCIARALFALIILKETFIVVGLSQGFVVSGTVLPPGTLTLIAPEALRAALVFGVSLALMSFTYGGHSWARFGLALNYLFLSGWAVVTNLRAADVLQTDASKVAVANAALGLTIGVALLLPSVGAFISWRAQVSRRLTIPLPPEDEPVSRVLRRARTLNEIIYVVFRWLGTLLTILLVTIVLALLYGYGDTIFDWLRLGAAP
jgi:hypothetical protein